MYKLLVSIKAPAGVLSHIYFLKNCKKKKFHFVAMASRAFDGIKCLIFFKEDLQRSISAKFSPNWPSGLEEKMFKEIVDDIRR